MLIQVISDIHLEHHSTIPKHLQNLDNIKAPYLFLLGDIGIPTKPNSLWLEYITWCNEQPSIKKIFYVLGNHESYSSTYEDTLTYIRNTFSKMPKFTLLEHNTIASLEDYTVLGCTLWTDIDFGTALLMNDMRNIYIPGKQQNPITLENLQSWYKRDKEWLEITLNDLQSNPAKCNKIIVATHHIPSMRLIPPKFQNPRDMKYAKGFASNLDHLIPLTNIWLFGHTHCHIDTMLDKTRCYANPMGYPGEYGVNYLPQKVIELD